ncbi:MAG: hypothetical protein JWL70_1891 [Acidimicrobiia bacterium]|nr:hypothetical protein [Acidimicrobiia bacterium]
MSWRDDYDWAAVGRGVVVAAVVAVPCGVAGAYVDNNAVTAALAIAIMVAMVAGAMVAAQTQAVGLPLKHGITAAIVVFVIAQVVGLLNRWIGNKDIAPGRILSNFLLSLIAGSLGGVIAVRRSVSR